MPQAHLPKLEDLIALEAELGRGGFGVVWRGHLRATREPLAVKIPHQAPGPEELARISREAELLRELSHPRLARFLGAFRASAGQVALVYELVDGVPLSRAGEGRTPGPEVLARWIEDAAFGLDALHEAGLVHRDVKPENLMVGRDGRVQVIDFGLARATATGGTLTAEGLLLGTPVFMAPEAFRGARLGAAADRFSLGVTAYWLLTRSLPFPGESPAEVAQRQREGPPPLRGVPGSAQDLSRAFRWALALEPADRPASCARFAVELRHGLEGSRGTAPRAAATAVVSPGAAPSPATPPHLDAEASPRDRRPVGPEGARATPRRVSERRRRARVRSALGLALVAVLGVGVGANLGGPRGGGQGPGDGQASPEAAGAGFGTEDLVRLREALSDLQNLAIQDRGPLSRREVFENSGGKTPGSILEFLGPDPCYWPRVRARLPGWERIEAWIQEGGRPQGLEEGLRAELRKTHQAFRTFRTVSPLARVYPSELASNPASLPRLASRDLPDLERAGPRSRQVLGLLEGLLASLEILQARMRADNVALPPELARHPRYRATLSPTFRIGQMIEQVLELDHQRRALLGLLLPQQEALLRISWLAGRALEAEPESAEELATTLFRVVNSDLRHLGRPLVFGYSPRELLGPEDPDSPCRALLELALGIIRLEGRRSFDEDIGQDREALLQLAVRAAGPGGGPAGEHRRDLATETRVRLLMSDGRPREAAEVALTRIRGLLREIPDRGLPASLLRAFLVLVLRLGDPVGTSARERRDLLQRLVDEAPGEDHVERPDFLVVPNPLRSQITFEAESLDQVREQLAAIPEASEVSSSDP